MANVETQAAPVSPAQDKPDRIVHRRTYSKTAVDIDSTQFWKSSLVDVDYWKVYLQARPKYHTGDFYDRVLDYHRSHQTNPPLPPTVAHDVGTGPGQVASVLADHFGEVVASDLNSTHLKVAELLLEEKKNVILHHAGGEEVSKHFPAYSADFVAAAECMPLMNQSAAIAGWASLLKPNGTLAMWFYGRPAFADAPDFDAAACNKAYDAICTRAFRPFYDVTGQRLANVRKATDTMVSWLDNIELDPSVWTDVRRWKWNADKPMEFSDAEDLGWPRNHIKKIHPGEKVQEFADRDMWSESWNIADWKAFLKVNLPDFNGEWIEEMTKLWSVLEEKMGGPDVKRKVIWPVVCVIATRKSDRSASFWA